MSETGISLGGGSLRGVAHIGALKELVKREISITHVAGTSAGAVVGGLFACGMHPESMVSALGDLSIRKHLDFGFNRKGWLKGGRIYQTLLKLTDGKYFSDLDIPFAVVCVDLNSRELTVIKEGEVAKALRAAIAIPGVFSPVDMGKRLLVDGYILNNNPADVVKKMGAKHVTAIRVLSSDKQSEPPTNLFSYVNRYIDIASHIHTDQQLKRHADILIDIDLRNIGRFDTKSLSAVMGHGEMEAKKVLDEETGKTVGEKVIYLNKWLKQTSN